MSNYKEGGAEFLSTGVVKDDIHSMSFNAISALKTIESSTILVTGASGFLASSIIYYILTLSSIHKLKITIIALARNPERFRNRISEKNLRTFGKYLHIHKYDIKQELTLNEKADFILHTASNADPLSFARDPFGTCLANTLGTINSIKYASKISASNYVYFSTSGVYGHMNPEDYPLEENKFGVLDPTRSENIYLISKRMAECLIAAENKRNSDFKYNIIRPSITYGPGININDVRCMSSFMKSALYGNDIMLKSEGLSTRNFLYIKDFVEAIILCIASPKNQAFNVASSIDTKIIDLANLICKLSSFDIATLNEGIDIGEIERVEFERTTTSQERVRKTFQWVETTKLADGINNTLNHYRSLI